MKRLQLLRLILPPLACSQIYAQSTLRFTTADTVNVYARVSEYWPYDTSWVAPVVYNLDGNTRYPVQVEVFTDSAWTAVLTRDILYRDSLVSMEFYLNGQLKIRNLSANGSTRAWLEAVSYYPNGQLKRRMRLDNDSLQLVTSYYADGTKESQMWWFAGSLFNEYTEWHENGRVKLEGFYERWPLQEARYTYPIGRWVYYMPNGEVEKIEEHGNGALNDR